MTKKNVEFVYDDDRSFAMNIEAYRDMDVVLVAGPTGWSDEPAADDILDHDIYDCVGLMSDESLIYAVNILDYSYETTDFPSEFVLWTYITRDIDSVLADLEANGYSIEELGEDHCSKAYVCRIFSDGT